MSPCIGSKRGSFSFQKDGNNTSLYWGDEEKISFYGNGKHEYFLLLGEREDLFPLKIERAYRLLLRESLSIGKGILFFERVGWSNSLYWESEGLFLLRWGARSILPSFPIPQWRKISSPPSQQKGTLVVPIEG